MEMERQGVTHMSMPECINYMTDMVTQAAITIFNKEGEVYASRNGSVRPNTKLLDFEKVLEVQESDDYIFPVLSKKCLKIEKWPGGKHFYIMENGKSVVIGDKVKYNTIQSAEDALDRYWKSIKRKNFSQIWKEKAYK